MTKTYSPELFATLDELKCVIGVLLASGVTTVPKRRDYWSTNDIKNNHAISSAISRNRFEQIFSNLHFVPKDSLSSDDKFQKVRLLLSKLNRRFEEFGPIANSFSVDETIVPYYGRHGAKQFIKGKPLRFGFKLWTLANSKGYAYHIQPYPGLAEKEEGFSASSSVVYFFAKRLADLFPGAELSITFGNYFTSIDLLTSLKKSLNITACGTVRVNRVPNCPQLDSISTDRGSMESW